MRLARGILLLAAVVTVAGLTKACGQRKRTADFQVSRSQINADLSTLYSQLKASGGADSDITQLESFLNLAQQPESSIYYSEAPSSLGDLNTAIVFPNWPDLFFRNSVLAGPVTKAWAYFVVLPTVEGWRGGLVMTIREAGAAPQGPAPTGTPGPTNGGYAVDERPTAIMVFMNDGKTPAPGTTVPLPPGELSSEEFGIEVARRRDVLLVLRSTDIYKPDLFGTSDEEGDLTDVIQLQVYLATYADETFSGLINMVQPN